MYKYVTIKFQVIYTNGKIDINEGQILVKEGDEESIEDVKESLLKYYNNDKIKEVKFLD